MLKRNEEVLSGLIPVTVKNKVDIDITNSTRVTHTPVLITKDGQRIILKGVPMSWVNYIAECVNNFSKLQDELKLCGYRIKKSTVIASLTIPGRILPISESNIITKSKDNQYMISYSKEYRKWLREVRESEWKMRSAVSGENLPIDFPIRLECIFHVKRARKQSILSEYIDSALEVLVKLGIIKTKTHRVVVNLDGSKIIYTTKKEHTVIIIHTPTED